MRPRNNVGKVYEYTTSSQADATWSEISLSRYDDEFDAAEEVAEKLWNDSDGEGHHDWIEKGMTIYLRLREEKEKVFIFMMDIELQPSFTAQQK